MNEDRNKINYFKSCFKPYFRQVTQSHQILLLEDNPLIRFMYSCFLSDLGYTYDLAVTGKEAIRLYRKHQYSLMLLDKNLPDMDSVDFCRFVRTEYSQKELPIFIITACGDTTEECLRAGCNQFFTKPINKEVLGMAIKQWTGLSKSDFVKRPVFTTSKRSAYYAYLN